MTETNIFETIRQKPLSLGQIRIKKADALETIMIEYLLILGMFSRWVEASRIWRLLLLILFCILLTKKIFLRRTKKLILSFWFLCPVALYLLSGVLGDSTKYFFFNLNRITWPVMIAISIAIIVSSKPHVAFKLFDKNFLFLNIVWTINIVVLAIQCSGTPFLIKKSWLEINSFYKDQCSGLFGNSGTHELSAFSIFMIMYDLYMGYYRKKGLTSKFTIGFAFITAGITLILSTQNDNMALLFILPLFIMLFYLQKAQWSGKNFNVKLIRTMKYVIPIIILLVIVVQIPAISDFITDKVIRRIDRMINYNATGIAGSNVRTAAVIYTFTKGRGWFLGFGVGTWPFAEGAAEGNFHGFTNFGLNSMSAYLMLGGVWMYTASVLLFARFLYIASYRKEKISGYFLICISVVILFTFYTVLFNSFQSMLWLMMTFTAFGFCRDVIKSKINRCDNLTTMNNIR